MYSIGEYKCQQIKVSTTTCHPKFIKSWVCSLCIYVWYSALCVCVCMGVCVCLCVCVCIYSYRFFLSFSHAHHLKTHLISSNHITGMERMLVSLIFQLIVVVWLAAVLLHTIHSLHSISTFLTCRITVRCNALAVLVPFYSCFVCSWNVPDSIIYVRRSHISASSLYKMFSFSRFLILASINIHTYT